MKGNIRFHLTLTACGLLCLAGCVSSELADMLVTAPNRQVLPPAVRDPAYARRVAGLYAQQFRVAGGPPSAELAVAVVEPGNYRHDYRLAVRETAGARWIEPQLEWSLPAEPRALRGTVVLLHGWGDAREHMLHWALELANSGWRCILVDLRGHGRSTGQIIGYGAFETADLRRVLDEAQARGIAGENVGVLGVSYGASMGLLWAADDPRIAAVVAIEPFSRAEEAVVEFARGAEPEAARRISDAQFAAATRQAAKKGGFSWESGDVLARMPRVRAAVLFLHGDRDTWLSPEHSRLLHTRAHNPSRFVLVRGANHASLAVRLDGLGPDARSWFDTHLAGAAPAPRRE